MKTLRILSINVHVGLGIYAGVIPWLMARLPGIHIVFVQEASRPRAQRAILKAFPSKKWIREGGQGDLVGTYVFLKRRRFEEPKIKSNSKVSDARPPINGRMPYPQRNLTSIVAVDRKTHREVWATSVHLWHMVGRSLSGKGAVARGHRFQSDRTANWHEQAPSGSLSVAGGDWNEDIGHLKHPDSARSTMARANMVPAGGTQAHLDEVFVTDKPFVKVKTWRYINTPFRAMDHPVLYVVLKVDEW